MCIWGQKVYKKYIKRIFDILLSLALLPVILVIIGLCGLLIMLDDRGPIFYCGKRLGRKGRIFRMYKLRTMKVNSPDLRNPDGSTYNSESDPRLTRVGRILRKTSLDELPQLFNVLKGEMSFIGPRPDLPEHINYYEGREIVRLDVLPGISGYSQAYYRNSAKWKHRLKSDVFYVDNISIFLDARILLKTIAGVLECKGIYSSAEKEGAEKVNDGGKYE